MKVMKRALVLCGGGSLGSYEIGAWKMFRELGISFDIVVGTSIGAINGAMVVTDRFDDAVRLWEEINTDEVMKYGIDFDRDFWGKVDFRRGSRFRKFLDIYVKDKGVDNTPFYDLLSRTIKSDDVVKSPTTFGCISVEYPAMREKRFLFNGADPKMVIPYLMASSACFPIFPRYRIGSKIYIDGGWKNNLPVDYALDLGADEIIGVLLRSFPPNPQKPEFYRDLPNVKVIYPTWPQGSLMSFKSGAISRNMELGYLDAGKQLGAFWGTAYAFKKNPALAPKAHAHYLKLLKKGPAFYHEAQKFLILEGQKPEDEIALYLRNLERIAAFLNLDPTIVYDPIEMGRQVYETFKSNPKDPKENANIQKEKDHYKKLASATSLGSLANKKTTKDILDLLLVEQIRD